MNRPTWILQQIDSTSGEQIVWITEDILRIDQTASAITYVLHKENDWNIVIANNDTCKIYANTLDEYLAEQAETEATGMKELEALNGGAIINTFLPMEKLGQTTIAGQSATEYSITQSWTAPKYSWTNDYHAWFANDIIAPEAGLSLIYMFGRSLHHDRALLRLTLKDEVLLDTKRIEKKTIDARKLISTPEDFDRVDSAEDIESDTYVDEASMSVSWQEP